jgi:Tol biopolymer transport system component
MRKLTVLALPTRLAALGTLPAVRPAPGVAAMTSPAPGSADLAQRRQPGKTVALTRRERLQYRCHSKGGVAMKRLFALVVAFALSLVGLAAVGGPAQAQEPGPNGQVAFDRFGPGPGGPAVYTMNPDGSQMRLLFARAGEFPHWSPDGTKVSVFCCDDGMAAHIVDVDTGDFRELAPPDPGLEVHCGLWSPDAQRFACESFGVTDPERNGIYSIRTSDGGGLRRITSNPGGDDTPGDYSPDGKRMVFVRADANGEHAGLYVTKVDGSGLLQIPTPGLIINFGFFAGSWSPRGNKILFVAQAGTNNRQAIYVVDADGSALRQLPIQLSCGGPVSDPRSTGCADPGWSPDGTKIVFIGVTGRGTQANIYTVNADGSHPSRLTNTGDAILPDWGPHPLAA